MIKRDSSLLEKLIGSEIPFTTSDSTGVKPTLELSTHAINKNMTKIRGECEKLFPKFLDIGYKIRCAEFSLFNDFAIFLCGQTTFGRVNFMETTIKSIVTKNLEDVKLKKILLKLKTGKFLIFGKNLAKKSTSLYAVAEFDINTLELIGKRNLDTATLQVSLFNDDLVLELTEAGISELKIDLENNIFERTEKIKGKFTKFDCINNDYLLSTAEGFIKIINYECNEVGSFFIGGTITALKYNRTGKTILAATDKKVFKISRHLNKKTSYELRYTPIDLYMDRKKNHIYVSTTEGYIVIIGTASNEIIYLPVHNEEIVHFFIDEPTEMIYTFGKDTKIGNIRIPSTISSIQIKKRVDNFLFCGEQNDFIYIEDKKFLIKWSLVNNKEDILFTSETELSRSMHYNKAKDLILFSEIGCFYLMKFSTSEIVKKFTQPVKVLINHSLFSDAGDFFFTVVAHYTQIFCFSTSGESQPLRLKGHDSKVNCFAFIKKEQFLVTGSNDCKIVVWDFLNQQKEETLTGHSDAVMCLALTREQNKIISGSKDKTIKVWDWRKHQLIVSLSGHHLPILKIRVDQLNQIYSVSSDGVVICWNPRAYLQIFKFTLNKYIIDFNLSTDYRIAAYSDTDTIKLIPFCSCQNNFDVIGPSSEDKYEYIYYIYKILKCDDVEYNEKWSNWAVLPYQFNTIMLYSFANMYRHINYSLENGAFLVPSAMSDPFSVVSSKRYDRCLKVFFLKTKTLLDKNLHALSYIDNKVLVTMNKIGHSHLHVFYDSIFRKYQDDDFPKIIEKSKLPKVVFAKHLNPDKQLFFGEENPEEEIEISKTGMYNKLMNEDSQLKVVPISLYISSIRMNYATGSKDITEFLLSIMKCHNKEIFRTKFIQTILDHKWECFKKYQILQAGCYFVYLGSLCFYLIFFGDDASSDYSPFIVFLCIALLLSCFDFFQMYKNFTLFWKDVWNYFDLTRLFAILTYSFCYFYGYLPDSRKEIMTIITFISFTRGVAFFRIFDQTRYLIQLIENVFVDMYSFILILAYSTFSFSIIQMVQKGGNTSYLEHLKQAFLVNLGEIDLGSDIEGFNWLIIALMGVINIIILLNMLISIMGDTFSRTKENSEIANYEEIAQMVLEIETVSVVKNTENKKSYLQLCEADSYSDLQDDLIEQEIQKIKKRMKAIHKILVNK